MSKVAVFVATRKGGWVFRADGKRKAWKASAPHFLGQIVHHLVLDPRDRKTLLAASRTGHLGPTVFRSKDFGKSWKEAAKPPAFPKAPPEPPGAGAPSRHGSAEGASGGDPKSTGQKGRVVDHTFWLTPGHPSEPNVWYGGTSPQGLFKSQDGGESWEPVTGFNDASQFGGWAGGEQDGTPDGPKLHSVIVDPRDPKHLYVGMSSGGVHESYDGGASWQTLIDGMEVVEGFDASKFYFHDPHCMRLCPSNPDRLYQQNHCGIYRLDRPGTKWERIGKQMPKAVGDIGFPMVVHPRDADVAWVFPMDGTTVWPRTSPGGKPAAFVTRDGGKKWKRLANGLPAKDAWWTVKRQAMSADALDPVGLYFGTTQGEVWSSRDEGAKWSLLARNLPEIYAVEAAEV